MQHESSCHAAARAATEARSAGCFSCCKMECKECKARYMVLDVLHELSIIAMQLHADASTMPSHRKTYLPADIKSGKV